MLLIIIRLLALVKRVKQTVCKTLQQGEKDKKTQNNKQNQKQTIVKQKGDKNKRKERKGTNKEEIEPSKTPDDESKYKQNLESLVKC